jgi:hypothetical protein
LPAELMGPGVANPDGHWEPAEVADFNDRILAAMDSEWSDAFGPRDLRTRRFPVETYLDEAVQIIRQSYGDQPVIVFKEPRVSILLELWRQALIQEGFRLAYIIMVRHPDEVARSLQKRDGLPYNQGLLIWSTYMLSAELGTRGASRVFVNFDQLLSDPEDILDKIEAGLGVNLARRTWDSTAEIQEFLKTEHKHFSFSGSASALKKLGPIRKFYDFLQAASLGEPWNVDFTDEMSAWLGDLEQAVGPVLKHLERELRKARKERDAASGRESDLAGARGQFEERERQLAAQLAQSQVDAADLRDRADGLETMIAGERAVAADQQANVLDRLAVHQAQVEASEAAARSAAARAEALERELEQKAAAAAARVEALERELEEKTAALTKVAALETALAEAERVVAAARVTANEMGRREAELQARLARITFDDAAHRQEKAQLQQELEVQRQLASEAKAAAHVLSAQAAIDQAELTYRLDAALAGVGDAQSRIQGLESALAEASAGRRAIEADLGAAAAREADLQARLAQAAAGAETDRAEKAELARALLDAVQSRSQSRGFWRSLFAR